MATRRLLWADMTKAVAIVAVLLGHTDGTPQLLVNFAFTFHMPLFFLISGYFQKRRPVCEAMKKDAKALLLPYAVTCLIMMILAALEGFLVQGDPLGEAFAWLLAGLYGSGGPIAPWAGTRIIGALWFLLALFVAKLIVNYTARFRCQGILILVIAYVGYATSALTWLPWSIQVGMVASLYVYLGMLFRKCDVFSGTFNKKFIPIHVFCLGVWLICIRFCGTLYMVDNIYGHGILDIIGSICAICCIVWLAMLVEKHLPRVSKALGFVGRATLPIICFHVLELNLFPWDWFFEVTGLVQNWALWLLLRCILVTIMVVCCYFIPFINRVYFPSLRARRREA